MKKNWDIFCKIVDNFGDIGVCWRLAKQLQAEQGLTIRLWIDDFNVAQKIIPNIDTRLNQQVVDEITIVKWQDKADFTNAADVVIEAFACELPVAYINAMAQKKSTWINLEYLSAESWVADFHAKPSPRANGLIRYFYFPGFTDDTGGLIRESNMPKLALSGHSDENRNPVILTFLDSDFRRNNEQEGALKISLFCYQNAPIHDLLTALQANHNKVIVYIPVSGILPKVANYFGKNNLEIGETVTKNNLTIQVLPFLNQADYDTLLSECDLNFVRGEDSWVRAIWAGKPFIWQPYFQQENTHIKKMDAFLAFFYADFVAKQAVFQVHADWVAAQLSISSWQHYLKQLSPITHFTLQQSQRLAQQEDLATKLVRFCNQID